MNKTPIANNTGVIDHALERFRQAAAKVITFDTPDKPTILGGRFPHHDLNSFLQLWRKEWSGDPYCIEEKIDKISFTKGFVGTLADTLQRLEIFNVTGHLTLRKDSSRWFWNYVGTHEPQQRVAPFTDPICWKSFWSEVDSQSVRLYEYDEGVLLWGEEIVKDSSPTEKISASVPKNGKILRFLKRLLSKWNRPLVAPINDPEISDSIAVWWEDRVAGAILAYPGMRGHHRVMLRFRRYTQGGQTAFIWYRELVGQSEIDHG